MNTHKPNNTKGLALGLGTIVLFIVAYFAYQGFAYVETDNAQVEAHSVMLAPKVSGFVKSVHVDEGQKVKAGDLLVELDDRDYINTSTNLEHTKIKAPTDGFIAKRAVELGQLASPGVPLIGFVSSDERWVTANFKETDISSIRVGAKVEVSVDALKGKKFIGEVQSLGAATGSTFALLPPDNSTGNFTKVVQRIPVKIKFSSLNVTDIDELRVGLSAVVKVHRY